MAFNTTKVSGNIIYSEDWNTFVDFTETTSSNAYKFSSNAKKIFYPSSLGKALYNFSSNKSLYAGSSSVRTRFPGSSQVNRSLIDSISSNSISKFAASTASVSRYAGSSNYSSHKSNADAHHTAFTSDNLTGDIAGTSPISVVGGDNVIKPAASVTISISNYIGSTQAIARFSDSSNSIGRYAPSTLTLQRYNQYTGHSGNTTKHVTTTISSNAKWAKEWLNASGSNLSSLLSSGNEYTKAYRSAQSSKIHSYHAIISSQYIKDYIASSTAIGRFYDSELDLTSLLNDNYVGSSSAMSKYLMSSAFKRNAWNSALWDNSSIVWDSALSSWKPKKSGAAGGVSNLSDLTIDSDKDWNTKSIYNAKSISSQVFSGGIYYTTSDDTQITNDRQLTSKAYVDAAITAGGGYTDEDAQDAVGAMVSTEFKYDDATPSLSLLGYIKISANAAPVSSAARSKYYPSSLGHYYTGSGTKFTSINSWFTQSSQKLSAISGNLPGKYAPSTLTDQRYDQYVGHSSNSTKHVTTTISTNAWYGKHITTSGIKYTWAYNSILQSGNEYTSAYKSASTGVFSIASHTHSTFGLWSGASQYYTVSSLNKAHSSNSTKHVTTTISTNAWYGKHFTSSGVKYTWAYNSILQSGNEYTSAYKSASTGVFSIASHTHSTSGLWSGASQFYTVSSLNKAHSSNSTKHVTTTISTNAWYGKHFSNSGVKYTWAYNSILQSGNEWYAAYNSAQRVKDLFDHTLYVKSTSTAFYNSESDLTTLLNDNYVGSSSAITKYLASSAFKRNGWNSSLWHNSSLIWDSSISAWKPQKSGAAGTTSLSDITITDKDWNTKSIYNAKSVSSQIFSGGTYYTTADAAAITNDRQLTSKAYVDDAISAGGGYTDEMAQDAVGGMVGVGLTYVDGTPLLYVNGYIASTNAISRFADSSNIRARFPGSSNVNRALINSISSNLDTRVDSIFGYSSNAKNLYANSGNVRSRFKASSGILTSLSSTRLSSNIIHTEDIHIDSIRLGTSESSPHTVRDWFRLITSAGRISGGTIYSSQTTKGKFNISGGQGLIRISDNDFAKLYFMDWDVSSGIYCPTGATRFCGVKYNSGTPVAFAQTTDTWDLDTSFPLGTVVNRSGQLDILSNPWWVSDGLTNVIERFDSEGYITRDDKLGGLILSESADGNRYVRLSAGKLWSRLNEFDITAKDTSGADRFTAYYRNAAGSWVVLHNQQTWPNAAYNDSDTWALGTVASNRYANVWFYVLASNKLAMVYDQISDTYLSAALAEAGTAPAYLPSSVSQHGILAGKIVFKGGETTAIETLSAFTTGFVGTQAADHGSLGGLSDDDHSQYYNITRINTFLTTISSNALRGSLHSSNARYYYYPSSLGKSLMNFSSNKSLYPASSLVNRSLINSISSNIDTRVDSLFNWSSNKGLYAPSTLTDTRYDQYVGHSGNTSKHVSTTFSSNSRWAYNWVNTSGSQISALLRSGNEYSQARSSGQRVKDLFDHTLYVQSSTTSFYNSEADLTALLVDVYFPSALGHNLVDGGDIGSTYHTHSQYGAGTTPGGGDHYVQYNNEGSFGGDSALTWNDVTNTLRISGSISGTSISAGSIKGNSITIGDVSNTEFGYLNGVTSAIQTQLDTKASITSYIASSVAINRFYPSTLGHPFTNSGTKFNWVYQSMVASGNEIYSSYRSASTGVFAIASHTHSTLALWSGAYQFYTVSGMVKTLDSWYDTSSSKLSRAYASTSTGKFEPTLTKGTLTATSPISLSDSTRQLIGGASVISISNYIGSTQSINRFADSSNVKTRFVPSSTSLSRYNQYVGHSGNTSKHVSTTFSSNSKWAYGWINTSGSQLSSLLRSGNEYSQAYASTSTGKFALASHTHTTLALWSGAYQFYVVSSSVKVLDSWYDTSSSKLSRAFVSTSTGKFEPALTKGTLTATSPITLNDSTRQLIGGAATISISNYIGSTQAISRFGDSSNIRFRFQASSLAKQSYLHSANQSIHSFNVINYMTSTNSISRFYPSAVGHYFTNSGVKFNKAYLSANKVMDLFNHTLYVASSIAISKFYDSEADLTGLLNDNYAGSANVNWTKIAAISSGFDGRLDNLEDNELFDHTLYVASSIAINKFYDSELDLTSLLNNNYPGSSNINRSLLNTVSSNLNSKMFPSSAGHPYLNSGTKFNWVYQSIVASGNEIYAAYKHSTNTSKHVSVIFSSNSKWAYGWLNTSGSQLSALLRSGNEYSQARSSGQRVKDLFFHELYVQSGTKWTDLTDGNDTILHIHDTRYYTETEVTTNYANSSNVRLRFPASSTALTKYYASASGRTYAYNHSSNNNIHIKGASSIQSGQVATWGSFGSNTPGWYNYLPPMTYSLANVKISAQQTIELAKFRCPTNSNGSSKKVYILQAHACKSSQAAASGLLLQVLSGTSATKIRFQTSSATLRQGYPISSTDGGNTTIRFGFSSQGQKYRGIHYGTCGIQISVI